MHRRVDQEAGAAHCRQPHTYSYNAAALDTILFLKASIMDRYPHATDKTT